MGLFTVVLLSGCETINNDSYCDLTSPLYFNSTNTVDSLVDTDKELLQDIITHNETWERICKE